MQQSLNPGTVGIPLPPSPTGYSHPYSFHPEACLAWSVVENYEGSAETSSHASQKRFVPVQLQQCLPFVSWHEKEAPPMKFA